MRAARTPAWAWSDVRKAVYRRNPDYYQPVQIGRYRVEPRRSNASLCDWQVVDTETGKPFYVSRQKASAEERARWEEAHR